MARFGNELSAFSIAQLMELLEDDEKLSQIVQDMEEVKKVQQSKEMTLVSNRSLAEQNLQLQPTLDHKKNELTKSYRSLQDLFEDYQMRKSTLEHQSGSGSLDTLLALLQAEGAKIEEETENMADSFLDGDVTLDSFIDEYQSKRKLAHLRRVKIEKLQELVLKRPELLQAAARQPPAADPAPLQRVPGDTPVPQPRRAPPLPPIKAPPAVPLAQPPTQPPAQFSYPPRPYPPIPPRVGQPMPGLGQLYPSMCMPQYPPPVPQRAAPRITPQPGFIIQ